jgi:hypothetical protein
MDPAVVGEASVWTRHRWRQCGVKADAEEERARGVNPVVVDEALAWTWRRSVRTRRLRRHGGGQGSGGRAGGSEMVSTWLGFKGLSSN